MSSGSSGAEPAVTTVTTPIPFAALDLIYLCTPVEGVQPPPPPPSVVSLWKSRVSDCRNGDAGPAGRLYHRPAATTRPAAVARTRFGFPRDSSVSPYAVQSRCGGPRRCVIDFYAARVPITLQYARTTTTHTLGRRQRTVTSPGEERRRRRRRRSVSRIIVVVRQNGARDYQLSPVEPDCRARPGQGTGRIIQ